MGIYIICLGLDDTLDELEGDGEDDGVDDGLGEKRGARGESEDNAGGEENEQRDNDE